MPPPPIPTALYNKGMPCKERSMSRENQNWAVLITSDRFKFSRGAIVGFSFVPALVVFLQACR